MGGGGGGRSTPSLVTAEEGRGDGGGGGGGGSKAAIRGWQLSLILTCNIRSTTKRREATKFSPFLSR